jgi:hypothetical protein
MLLHLRAEVHPSTSWLPAVLILYEVRLHFPRRRPRAPQALLAMTSSVPISMNLCGRLVLAPLASLARNRQLRAWEASRHRREDAANNIDAGRPILTVIKVNSRHRNTFFESSD